MASLSKSVMGPQQLFSRPFLELIRVLLYLGILLLLLPG
jgi:hypothetical protein